MLKKTILTCTVFAMLFIMNNDLNAQQMETSPRDGAYDRNLQQERVPIAYPHLREADVFWQHRVWREIDTRQKMNLYFRYPNQYFVDILRDHIIENEITAYSAMDDRFTDVMTSQEVQDIGAGTDTIWVVDPVTLEETQEIVVNEFNPESVVKIRLKEDWIFDKQTSTMIVRIIGIAPIIQNVDEQGNIRGDEVMFWVYYPDARDVLAKYDAFNDGNYAVRLSFEDIFEMRYFDSFIIKEVNVHDRRVVDYATGVDALLESDRIKEKIFNFEQDLWSY
jgi:gliding motility associated protien GldN